MHYGNVPAIIPNIWGRKHERRILLRTAIQNLNRRGNFRCGTWAHRHFSKNFGNLCTLGYEIEINHSNILASGKLFRFISKLIGLWNPRKKHYALLCTIFVVLNILSLLAEILIPSICGPFVDRCVTHSKSVTNKTSSDSELMERVARIYETTLAFDAWNAFSDTMTYILLIYTLWRSQQRLPYLSLASAQVKLTSCEWLTINVMLIICSLAISVASAFRISVVEPSKMKFYGSFGLGVLIVYLTAFTLPDFIPWGSGYESVYYGLWDSTPT